MTELLTAYQDYDNGLNQNDYSISCTNQSDVTTRAWRSLICPFNMTDNNNNIDFFIARPLSVSYFTPFFVVNRGNQPHHRHHHELF